MRTIENLKDIKNVGVYVYNNIRLDVNEITTNGRLRGVMNIDGNDIEFSNSLYFLRRRIENGGKHPAREKSGEKRTNGMEKTFLKLQKQLADAEIAFRTWQAENKIFTLNDAKKADADAHDNKQAAHKRAKKQATRRTEDAMLKRVKILRRWAKNTNRAGLYQALTDKLLEITE